MGPAAVPATGSGSEAGCSPIRATPSQVRPSIVSSPAWRSRSSRRPVPARPTRTSAGRRRTLLGTATRTPASSSSTSTPGPWRARSPTSKCSMSEPESPGRADRSLGAFVVGGAAAVIVFVGLLSAGVVLYQRVYGDSWVALLVILAVFGGLGAYLAWLVGVLAFSAVRRKEGGRSSG